MRDEKIGKKSFSRWKHANFYFFCKYQGSRKKQIAFPIFLAFLPFVKAVAFLALFLEDLPHSFVATFK